MTKPRTFAILAACAPLAVLTLAQQSGSIAGVVADQNGAPVAGALILYHSIPPYTADGTKGTAHAINSVSSGLTAGADGSFAIPELADGKYSVCAYAATATQLGSCEWGGNASPIQITGGMAVNNVALQLREGTLLTFFVSDPYGLILDTAAGPSVNGLIPLYGGNFRIGVMLGPIYARAEFASQQGTVRSYTVTVPKNVSLDLIADTSLLITAATGAAVPIRQKGFLIPTGNGSAQTVRLSVR